MNAERGLVEVRGGGFPVAAVSERLGAHWPQHVLLSPQCGFTGTSS